MEFPEGADMMLPEDSYFPLEEYFLISVFTKGPFFNFMENFQNKSETLDAERRRPLRLKGR